MITYKLQSFTSSVKLKSQTSLKASEILGLFLFVLSDYVLGDMVISTEKGDRKVDISTL